MRLTFGSTELLHLVVSVLALTAAFAFVLNPADGILVPERFAVPWVLYLASFLAVASGFVLHELAHKLIAQLFGHWAEFRAWFQGLAISLGIAAVFGFLFATPGAVHIWGRVTQRENGLISVVGPGVNFVIAAAALPVALVADITDPVPYTFAVISVVNAILCLFNLLPLWNLDGRKVLRWSKLAYAGAMLLAIGMVTVLVLTDVFFLGQ